MAKKEINADLKIAREGAWHAWQSSVKGVTADDAQAYLFSKTGTYLGKGLSGHIFVKKVWKFSGELRASNRDTNKSHLQPVWNLIAGATLKDVIGEE